MTDEALLRKLDALPDAPGVYLWKDKDGGVLYVGKANSLRQRVRWYLGEDAAQIPRFRLLRIRATDIDSIVVQSESQALLLENNLIKQHQPRFNVKLRDDKDYLVLRLATDHRFLPPGV